MNKPEAFGAFPKLETDKLVLRRVTHKDAEALMNLYSDAEATRLSDVPILKTPEEAREVVHAFQKLFKQNKGIRWAILRKTDNQFLGTCGYINWVKARDNRGEMVQELGRAYWGQGFMTEALRAILQYGFGQMSLNRVEAQIDPEDTRAQILLSKLGFQQEGVLREHNFWQDRFWDVAIYSLLAREWKTA